MAWCRRLLILWLACAALTFAPRCVAALRLQVDVFEDTGMSRSYPEVKRARFTRLDPSRVNAGYSRAAYWLRIRVGSDASAPTSWMLETSHAADHAELYDGVTVRRSGKLVPYAERDVHANGVAFRVALAPHSEQTLYLRLQSSDTLGFGVEVWEANTFAERQLRENLFSGAYYGLVLGIVLYNLFLYFSTRDRPYLLYVFFQLSFLLVQASMDSLGFQCLWPGSVWFAQRSDEVTATIVMFLALRFGCAYLETERRSPRLHRWMIGASWLALALTACALVRDDAIMKLTFAAIFLPTIGLLIFAGVEATKEGMPNGPYYLGAWIFFISGCFVHMLSAVGLLQTSSGPAMAVLKIGSAAEATLLSLGLGNRLRLLRDAERCAQSQLLEERQAHNRLLETRVEERTRELRDAQALLVRQERLVVLGRLAASVGHEVSNPLNFVAGGASELARALEQGALEDARRALKLVLSGSERIKRVVTNLRSYVISVDVPLQPVDLVAELTATLELTAELCARCGVKVQRVFQPLPPFRARPGELEQVFMNIVLNACDAMVGGGTLAVSTRVTASALEIRFTDDGPGVPREMRESIFEAFTRGGERGTGLGLFVSREIVLRHGGELRCTDSTTGASFLITLPVA